MNDNQKPDKDIVIGTAMATGIAHMDPPPLPPPPDYVSPFKSVQEWLVYLCGAEDPQKVVEDIQFGISTTRLSVLGFNHIELAPNEVYHRQDFRPAHSYFPLPKEDYANELPSQVRENIRSVFVELMKTELFQQSFLAKAKRLVLHSDGEIIRLI